MIAKNELLYLLGYYLGHTGDAQGDAAVQCLVFMYVFVYYTDGWAESFAMDWWLFRCDIILLLLLRGGAIAVDFLVLVSYDQKP